MPPAREAVAAHRRRRVLGSQRAAEHRVLPGGFLGVFVVLLGPLPRHDFEGSRDAGQAEVAVLHLGGLELRVSLPSHAALAALV